MPDRVDLTVATLVRDRNALLARLVDGLAVAPQSASRLVVAWCGGEDPHPVLDRPLPFEVEVVDVGGGDHIPYATARNAAASQATTRHLAFLDADCVPGRSYAASLAAALDVHDALATGEVWYLPPEAPTSFDEPVLRALGRVHPHRARPPAEGVALDDRHELAWGLHQAFRAATFEQLGGFDEGFGGYAGEDTDLAVRAREAGVPLALVAEADIYHQHHDSWEPPLQQFRATLANARHFHRTRGWWPMGGWLEAMADLGLIAWTPDAEELRILRDPTAAEVAAARCDRALPFRGWYDDGRCG